MKIDEEFEENKNNIKIYMINMIDKKFSDE